MERDPGLVGRPGLETDERCPGTRPSARHIAVSWGVLFLLCEVLKATTSGPVTVLLVCLALVCAALRHKRLSGARAFFRDALRAPRGRMGLLACLTYSGSLAIALAFLASADVPPLVRALVAATQGEDGARNVLDVLLSVALVPLCEELAFRGRLLRDVIMCYDAGDESDAKDDRSVRSPDSPSFHALVMATYVTALVFWLFHAPASIAVWLRAIEVGGIPIGPGPFLLGLVCAVIAIRDRSLRYAIVFHGLANAAGPFWGLVFLRLGAAGWMFHLFYR